jgi:hypothetical protein
VGITFLYYSRYAKVDEDDFGHAELFREGFQASFGLFLVSVTQQATQLTRL